MANPAVIVDFKADTRDLSRGMSQAGTAAGGLKSKLAGIAKAGAVAGLAALTATLKAGVSEWAEAQKVTAQTEAVLKSTGKAAGVSAKDVASLSEALMKKSGVDDEAIQSGQNLLLTFTNIRNEAGKGNDVFDQATKAALDMSVAMGTDMKTAAMQVGKALNDPVKGMSKLQRVGVTFTDAQKKQVEAMVEAGDAAGAQKIILKELQKEFGGSAEAAGKTLPGQLKILREEFNNVAGALVGRLIPPLLATIKFLDKHRTAVVAVVAVLATMTAGIYAVSFATKAWAAAQAIASAATKAWAGAQWLLNAALSANPIALVIVAVVALVAALVLAYKKSETFRKIVDGAFKAVLSVAKTLFGWIKSNWPLLLQIIAGPIGLAAGLIIKHWATIKNAVTGAISAVKSTIVKGWNAVKDATSSAWHAVSGAVKSAVSTVKSVLGTLASWVSGWASGTFRAVVNRVGDMFHRIGDGARDAAQGVRNAFNGVIDWLQGLVGRMGNVASRIGNALKAPINAVLRAWNSISLTIPRISIPKLKIGKKTFGGGSFGGQTIGFPNVPLLAKGAVVDRPTLAMIGEKGRELVTPEKLLRDIVGDRAVQVRVYIGERELTDIVRVEVNDQNTGLARTLLAGGAA